MENFRNLLAQMGGVLDRIQGDMGSRPSWPTVIALIALIALIFLQQKNVCCVSVIQIRINHPFSIIHCGIVVKDCSFAAVDPCSRPTRFVPLFSLNDAACSARHSKRNRSDDAHNPLCYFFLG